MQAARWKLQEREEALPEDLEYLGRTALVIDDESNVVMVLKRFLRRKGFDVLAAHDGRTALGLFKKHFEQIDFVLLDLTMPGLSGEEVLASLRRMSRGVRVILCTGSTRDEAEERVGSLEGLGFLKKPFTPEQLYDAIDEILGT